MNALYVEHCWSEITDESRMGRDVSMKIDDGSLGWRVIHATSDMALPVRFLRERDATIAMHSIEHLVDWSLTIEEILKLVDTETITQEMTRNLAW